MKKSHFKYNDSVNSEGKRTKGTNGILTLYAFMGIDLDFNVGTINSTITSLGHIISELLSSSILVLIIFSKFMMH